MITTSILIMQQSMYKTNNIVLFFKNNKAKREIIW